ncbi:MAG TPA: hypothetical protein PK690_13905, partial [Emcibacteraceae bacterium]|nr:hypothetical protein [Emcibacteraceae bacterium]
MKKIFISLSLLLLTICPVNAQVIDDPNPQPRILPLRERAKQMDEMTKYRLDTLIPALMRRERISAWVIISREYNEDPVMKTMLPATWLSARRRTVLIFLDHGPDEGVERLAVSRYDVGDLFKGSWNPDEFPNQWRRIA